MHGQFMAAPKLCLRGRRSPRPWLWMSMSPPPHVDRKKGHLPGTPSPRPTRPLRLENTRLCQIRERWTLHTCRNKHDVSLFLLKKFFKKQLHCVPSLVILLGTVTCSPLLLTVFIGFLRDASSITEIALGYNTHSSRCNPHPPPGGLQPSA